MIIKIMDAGSKQLEKVLHIQPHEKVDVTKLLKDNEAISHIGEVQILICDTVQGSDKK